MPTENPGDNFFPATVNAGDTWQGVISLPIYPAMAGWSAVWQIRGLGQAYNFNLTVDPNGSDFDYLVPALTTANIPPGLYAYRVIVIGTGVNSGLQFTALPLTPKGGFARITVAPNLSAVANYDARSQYEIELGILQATILQLETNQVASATYSGQTFTSQDIQKLRDREVQLIERIKAVNVQERILAGQASGRQTQIRFQQV